jgi:hypothetical protein
MAGSSSRISKMRCDGGRPLCLQQHEAQHPKRDGDHDHVAGKRQQGADPDAVLDRQPAAVEQDRGHSEAGEGLDQGVEAGPGVDEGGGRPAQPLGRPGQLGDLLGLGGERLHHPRAAEVLVDHHGDLGHAALGDPRQREHQVPHPLAQHEHERHGRHGQQGERHVDAQHEADGQHKAQHREPGERPEGQQQLDGTDVGVGP